MEKLRFSYDDESDVLYVSIGKPKEAVAIETEIGIFRRESQKTGEVVGVTILDFKERYLKKA